MAAAIAVFLHEVPQEIGDFGVLMKGGFSRTKALTANFLTALTAFLGAGFGLLSFGMIEGILPYYIAFSIGGFVYIAGTDLIPQLNKCEAPRDSFMQLIFILIGNFMSKNNMKEIMRICT